MRDWSDWPRRVVPQWAKVLVWLVTDPVYRHVYLTTRRKIRQLRDARRAATPLIYNQTGGVVASGPFRGLQYIESWDGSYFSQKLLGTYEKELHDTIEEICLGDYQKVIDIGAAEGYYACGLVHRMPAIRMVAFEADTRYHAALREIASRNSLSERIEIFGRCEADSLASALDPRDMCLVICDAEGAEFDLLDPSIVPRLFEVDLLVEVHEDVRPGVIATLTNRFAATHTILPVGHKDRTEADLPPAITLKPDLALQAMDECRGTSADWLWMPRSLVSGPIVSAVSFARFRLRGAERT